MVCHVTVLLSLLEESMGILWWRNPFPPFWLLFCVGIFRQTILSCECRKLENNGHMEMGGIIWSCADFSVFLFAGIWAEITWQDLFLLSLAIWEASWICIKPIILVDIVALSGSCHLLSCCHVGVGCDYWLSQLSSSYLDGLWCNFLVNFIRFGYCIVFTHEMWIMLCLTLQEAGP